MIIWGKVLQDSVTYSKSDGKIKSHVKYSPVRKCHSFKCPRKSCTMSARIVPKPSRLMLRLQHLVLPVLSQGGSSPSSLPMEAVDLSLCITSLARLIEVSPSLSADLLLLGFCPTPTPESGCRFFPALITQCLQADASVFCPAFLAALTGQPVCVSWPAVVQAKIRR